MMTCHVYGNKAIIGSAHEKFILACSSADPEGGTGGPDPPPPWKITSYMGFYRE